MAAHIGFRVGGVVILPGDTHVPSHMLMSVHTGSEDQQISISIHLSIPLTRVLLSLLGGSSHLDINNTLKLLVDILKEGGELPTNLQSNRVASVFLREIFVISTIFRSSLSLVLTVLAPNSFNCPSHRQSGGG